VGRLEGVIIVVQQQYVHVTVIRVVAVVQVNDQCMEQ
jgi:hypothetical protein